MMLFAVFVAFALKFVLVMVIRRIIVVLMLRCMKQFHSFNDINNVELL